MSVIDGIQRKMCIVQKGNKMVRISLQVQVTDKTSIFKAQCTEKAWEWGSLIVEVWIRTEAATEWEKKVSYKENTQSSLSMHLHLGKLLIFCLEGTFILGGDSVVGGLGKGFPLNTVPEGMILASLEQGIILVPLCFCQVLWMLELPIEKMQSWYKLFQQA